MSLQDLQTILSLGALQPQELEATTKAKAKVALVKVRNGRRFAANRELLDRQSPSFAHRYASHGHGKVVSFYWEKESTLEDFVRWLHTGRLCIVTIEDLDACLDEPGAPWESKMAGNFNMLIDQYIFARKHAMVKYENAVVDEFILQVCLLGDRLDALWHAAAKLAAEKVPADAPLMRFIVSLFVFTKDRHEYKAFVDKARVWEWPLSVRGAVLKYERWTVGMHSGPGFIFPEMCEHHHAHTNKNERNACLDRKLVATYNKVVEYLVRRLIERGRTEHGVGGGQWAGMGALALLNFRNRDRNAQEMLYR